MCNSVIFLNIKTFPLGIAANINKRQRYEIFFNDLYNSRKLAYNVIHFVPPTIFEIIHLVGITLINVLYE